MANIVNKPITSAGRQPQIDAIQRSADHGASRLEAERKRMERAKRQVEARRKGGNSHQHLDKLRYGGGIFED